MEKIISIALVIVLLASSLFILTGCGNNGEEQKTDVKVEEKVEEKAEGKTITYDYSGTNVSVMVPEESTYEWTEDKPENSIYFKGTFYLVGEEEPVVMSITSDKYFGDNVTNFDEWVAYLKTDSYTGTITKFEEVTLNGRKALKTEIKYGSTSDPDTLYGYRYYIDGGETDPGLFYEVSIVKSDFSTGNVTETMSSESISNIINSLTFTN